MRFQLTDGPGMVLGRTSDLNVDSGQLCLDPVQHPVAYSPTPIGPLRIVHYAEPPGITPVFHLDLLDLEVAVLHGIAPEALKGLGIERALPPAFSRPERRGRRPTAGQCAAARRCGPRSVAKTTCYRPPIEACPPRTRRSTTSNCSTLNLAQVNLLKMLKLDPARHIHALAPGTQHYRHHTYFPLP